MIFPATDIVYGIRIYRFHSRYSIILKTLKTLPYEEIYMKRKLGVRYEQKNVRLLNGTCEMFRKVHMRQNVDVMQPIFS